jgi:hypothetical protein
MRPESVFRSRSLLTSHGTAVLTHCNAARTGAVAGRQPGLGLWTYLSVFGMDDDQAGTVWGGDLVPGAYG